MTNIISRPAGDKSKGFDTQVLRAISIMLGKLNEGQEQVYSAVEVIEDVFVMEDVEDGNFYTTLEEDKNYSSKFSFRSEPVRNTLVSFFDQYIKFDKDPKLSLCFYAQTITSNETISSSYVGSIEGLCERHCGTKSILKNLNDGKSLDDVELEIAFEIFKDEYISQYSDRKDKKTGFINIVKVLTKESFGEFLYSISWTISDENDNDLETDIFKKIRDLEYFDYKYENKEEFILSRIVYEFIKRKSKPGFISKLINRSDIEVIFLKSVSEYAQKDMSWKYWNEIEVDDVRNLNDKILSVCPDFKARTINKLYRKVGVAKVEELSLGRDYISLKVRVLAACDDLLDSFVDDSSVKLYPVKDIINKFKELEEESIKMIDGLKKDYAYNASNEEVVKGIVYALFDECYLAFDDYE